MADGRASLVQMRPSQVSSGRHLGTHLLDGPPRTATATRWAGPAHASARIEPRASQPLGGFASDRSSERARARVRLTLAVVFCEAVLFFGGFTFFGAYLNTRYGLDYARIGLMLAFFGLGGLVSLLFK